MYGHRPSGDLAVVSIVTAGTVGSKRGRGVGSMGSIQGRAGHDEHRKFAPEAYDALLRTRWRTARRDLA